MMKKIQELAKILEESIEQIEDYEDRRKVNRTIIGLYYAMRAEIGASTVKQLAEEILNK